MTVRDRTEPTTSAGRRSGGTGADLGTATAIPGLHASPPAPLPFAPALEIRAFLLRRDEGNVLLHSAPGVDETTFADAGPVARAYLGHHHEASFGTDLPGVPLFVHEADRAATARHRRIRATFARRHLLGRDLEVIPIPGHTPGATAFLWDTGRHRLLFPGDTIVLHHGEWTAAVLGSSDRAAYLRSLELLRGLRFDVLVPWAATADGPPYARTTPSEARRRLDAMAARLRRGEDR